MNRICYRAQLQAFYSQWFNSTPLAARQQRSRRHSEIACESCSNKDGGNLYALGALQCQQFFPLVPCISKHTLYLAQSRNPPVRHLSCNISRDVILITQTQCPMGVCTRDIHQVHLHHTKNFCLARRVWNVLQTSYHKHVTLVGWLKAIIVFIAINRIYRASEITARASFGRFNICCW